MNQEPALPRPGLPARKRSEPSRTTLSPGIRRMVTITTAGLSLLLLLTVVGVIGVRARYVDRIYPAVTVAGVDLGGMSLDEARAAVAARTNELLSTTISLSYADRQWSPTLSDLGVTIDPALTVDRAYGVGREDSARSRLFSTIGSLRSGEALTFQYVLDESVLNQWFDAVDLSLGPPPHDAGLVVTNGIVSVTPEIDGLVIDRQPATQLILGQIGLGSPSPTQLPIVQRMATLRSSDVAPARAKLEAALAQPVTLDFGDQSWTLQPSDIGHFVRTTIDPAQSGTNALILSVDQDALTAWLDQLLASEVNTEPRNATVIWGGEKKGAVPDRSAENGLAMETSKLAGLVIGSFFGSHEQVTIPVATVEPELTDADVLDLGITTRLATGETNFDMSDPERIENIKTGVYHLNGTLIPPHGEFSFNHSIGVITVERGFVESQVINGERVGRDVGGGICQVSTTVFRAAFYAGLPITEWHSHRYRLGFYEYDNWPPGLDASIMQPEGDPFGSDDFRFENPSDSWMLVEAYTDGVYVYVKLYGADLGYTVTVDGPELGDDIPPTEDVEFVDWTQDPGTMKQTEWAQPGLEVHFQRTVTDRNGNVVEDEPFDTYFFPRGNVWTVSEDMAGQSPAATKDG